MKQRLSPRSRVTSRALLVLAGLVAASLGVGPLLARAPLGAWERVDAGGLAALPFDAALSAVCSAALLACWSWGVLVCCLTLLDAVRAGGTSRPLLVRRGCPRPLRAAVLALCGVAVGAVLASPAHAGLGGLDLPDRSVGAPVKQVDQKDQVDQVVTVRPGDSLWSITRRMLPPDADDAAVAAAWPRLHRHNRDRLGADPDLIHPGTRLRVPVDLSPGKDRS